MWKRHTYTTLSADLYCCFVLSVLPMVYAVLHIAAEGKALIRFYSGEMWALKHVCKDIYAYVRVCVRASACGPIRPSVRPTPCYAAEPPANETDY